MSKHIDHAAEAQRVFDIAMSSPGGLDQWGVKFRDRVAVAQFHAVLALVEQQRVANLIALAAGGHGGATGFEHEAMDALGVLGTPHHLQLRSEIAKALGIGDSDE